MPPCHSSCSILAFVAAALRRHVIPLHLSLADQAAALCFSLLRNYSFLDASKRAAHAAMETFLTPNGSEIEASVDEQERLMLDIAAGRLSRNDVAAWLREHVRSLS
jgi:death on curing protein